MFQENISERFKFDNSENKFGRQAIGNRLKYIFDDIRSKLTYTESDNRIRRLLKLNFGFPEPNKQKLRPGSGFRKPGNNSEEFNLKDSTAVEVSTHDI